MKTGPKGVLTDYYRSQEEEKRRRLVEKEKRQEMIQRHSATARTYVRRGVWERDCVFGDVGKVLGELRKVFWWFGV